MLTFKTKTFKPLEVIFEEGDSGERAYILREGSVEISIKTGDESYVLSVLKPVTVFGEIALLLDSRRTATAKALERTEVIEIDREALDSYIEKSPLVISTILRALVERLKNTDEKLSKGRDLYRGVCERLHDLSLQIRFHEGIDYEKAADDIACALNVEKNAVEEKLGLLEVLNLIEIKIHEAGRVIYLQRQDEFLKKALKIYQALL
ncbi:MAG: cyclic nucleotide-binding domain-containing protein [Deltaproteobacteria bacterium]|nr:cyclic nucleotide-binding domain-containing protein [Deltaproteobacteria bacterium]